MKLWELFESEDSDDTLGIRLTGILTQMRARIKDTGADKKISLGSVLSKLYDAGISLSPEQFREMYKSEPLSNIIANVAGDDVVFLGQSGEDTGALDPDQTTDTLEKMAKRASKK